jgi:hypothetical protein
VSAPVSPTPSGWPRLRVLGLLAAGLTPPKALYFGAWASEPERLDEELHLTFVDRAELYRWLMEFCPAMAGRISVTGYPDPHSTSRCVAWVDIEWEGFQLRAQAIYATEVTR